MCFRISEDCDQSRLSLYTLLAKIERVSGTASVWRERSEKNTPKALANSSPGLLQPWDMGWLGKKKTLKAFC